MFQSEELDSHLKTSNVIKSRSIVTAEWNMNDPDNVKMLGNYRYRPSWSSSPYYLLPSNFDELDQGNYFTGATDSDAVIDSGFVTEDQPSLFITPKKKMEMLFSLEDCVRILVYSEIKNILVFDKQLFFMEDRILLRGNDNLTALERFLGFVRRPIFD